MHTNIFLLSVLALVFPVGRPAAAQTPAASGILAAMKSATGGAAWDRVATLHLVSAVKQGGLTGTQDEWDDTLTGHHSVSSVLGPSSERDGYDGVRAWSQDTDGLSHYVAAADDVAAAHSAAYRVSLAYWFSARFSGTISYREHTDENGRGFDVLQITPSGGRPFQLWVEDKTHLADRTVEQGAAETDTTFFTDYRSVSGVLLPFRTRVSTGDPRYGAVNVTQSVVVNASAPAGIFTLPPLPPPDYTLAGNASSVTVPFQYEGDHILVDIRINGRGLFPAFLDSGGQYAVTSGLARRLSLTSQGTLAGTGNGTHTVDVGFARAESVSIGGLTLRRPLFYVVPLPAIRDHPIVG